MRSRLRGRPRGGDRAGHGAGGRGAILARRFGGRSWPRLMGGWTIRLGERGRKVGRGPGRVPARHDMGTHEAAMESNHPSGGCSALPVLKTGGLRERFRSGAALREVSAIRVTASVTVCAREGVAAKARDPGGVPRRAVGAVTPVRIAVTVKAHGPPVCTRSGATARPGTQRATPPSVAPLEPGHRATEPDGRRDQGMTARLGIDRSRSAPRPCTGTRRSARTRVAVLPRCRESDV